MNLTGTLPSLHPLDSLTELELNNNRFSTHAYARTRAPAHPRTRAHPHTRTCAPAHPRTPAHPHMRTRAPRTRAPAHTCAHLRTHANLRTRGRAYIHQAQLTNITDHRPSTTLTIIRLRLRSSTLTLTLTLTLTQPVAWTCPACRRAWNTSTSARTHYQGRFLPTSTHGCHTSVILRRLIMLFQVCTLLAKLYIHLLL